VTPDPWTGSNIKSGDITFEGVPITAGINFRPFIVVKIYTQVRAFLLRSRAVACSVKNGGLSDKMATSAFNENLGQCWISKTIILITINR
jgi:hypothetical protein